MSDSSYIEATAESSTPSEIDSLPSSPTTSTLQNSSSSSEAEEGESDAEREWKESLQQLELLLTMVVVPYVGKYFGRKCAYWGEFSSFFWGLRLCFVWFLWGGARGEGRWDLCADVENNRLGSVHGMEIPGRGDCDYESEGIQGCGRC